MAKAITTNFISKKVSLQQKKVIFKQKKPVKIPYPINLLRIFFIYGVSSILR